MKTHQKMCWSCDGHVHVYEMQCPYCGADLTEQEVTQEAPEDEQPIQDSIEEELPLPEHMAKTLEDELSHPPFQSLIEDAEQLPVQEERWEESEHLKEPDLDNPLASLLLLLPGSLFLIFGLALFLFSQDGFLVFKFSTKYWFVYLLGSWPLLYFGWRSLFPAKPLSKEIEEEPEEETLEDL